MATLNLPASSLPYDNTASGATADNVQEAIDEAFSGTSGAISSHEGASDPHPGYLTAAEAPDAVHAIILIRQLGA